MEFASQPDKLFRRRQKFSRARMLFAGGVHCPSRQPPLPSLSSRAIAMEKPARIFAVLASIHGLRCPA